MGVDLPDEWEEAVQIIIKEKPSRVLVVGEADAGKSTFAAHLLRKLLETHLTCSLVDADIGQKDLGPPAAITLGVFKHLQELKLQEVKGMYFVGSTSPRGHLLPIAVGTKLLADRAEGVAVINTTGFITGAGFALKSFKIELLKPEFLIALQRGTELDSLLQSYSSIRCLRLPVSAKAKFRSFEERRALRREAFRRYFSFARELEVKGIRFQRLSSENALPQLKTHLLLGLAGSDGELLGLGIAKNSDAATLRLLTPIKDRIAVVQLGSILVREDGEELGFVR